MSEIQKENVDETVSTFENNDENIIIKYKLLRSLIIKHYHRGCKYLEIAKIIAAAIYLILVAVGVALCSNGGNKAFWLVLWIVMIFVDITIFLITDYCKYLVKSKVIPYLENDSQVEFGEYSIFSDEDDEEEDDEDEYEREYEEKRIKKKLKKQEKKRKKSAKRKGDR